MKKNKETTTTQKPKKPFYKKWWFWVIVVLILIAATGGSKSDDTSSSNPGTVSSSVSDSTKVAQASTVAVTETTAEAFTIPSAQSFGNGMYKVGSDIDAGEYYVTCSEYLGAYIEVSSDSSGTLESIIANDNIDTFTFITVSDGQYLTVNGGEFVKAEDAFLPSADLNGVYMSGMYRVGIDIPAGEYKVTCTNGISAYVEVSSNSTHTLDSIVSNANVETTHYITVQDGQYLTVTGGEFSPA